MKTGCPYIPFRGHENGKKNKFITDIKIYTPNGKWQYWKDLVTKNMNARYDALLKTFETEGQSQTDRQIGLMCSLSPFIETHTVRQLFYVILALCSIAKT